MLRFLLVVINLVAFSSFAFSQHTETNETEKNFRIEKDKPSVYLEFVNIGKRKSKQVYSSDSETTSLNLEEYDAVWLRLHNNSNWAIQVLLGFHNLPFGLETKSLQNKGLVFTPRLNASDLELMYGVESVNAEVQVTAELKQKLPYVKRYRPLDELWLFPKQSVVFPVRREELSRNLQIYLPFKYEWEASGKNKGIVEPQHRVYFTWNKFEKAAGL